MLAAYVERLVRFGFGLLAAAILLAALVHLAPPPSPNAGSPIRGERAVAELVGPAVPATLTSLAVGVAYALPLALLLGIPAGLRPNSPLDRALQRPAAALAGLPAFTLALLAVLILLIQYGVLSLPGASLAALTLVLAAWLARAVRDGLAGVRPDGLPLPYGKAAVAVLGRVLQQTGNLLLLTLLVGSFSGGPAGGLLRLVTHGAMTRDLPLVYGALWALVLCALAGHLIGDLLVTATEVKGGAQGRLSRGWLAAGGLLTAVLLITALLGSGDPMELRLAERLMPPGPGHLLGADQYGRDLFSRIGYGARVSLAITGAATLLATVGGGLLAFLARAGGPWGWAILTPRTAVPNLFGPVVAGLVGGLIFGPSIPTLMVSLGVASIPSMALAFRQFLQPEAWGRRFAAAAGLTVLTGAQVMMAEQIISFLALGVQPPSPSLGSLVYEATFYVRTAPHLLWAAVPGAAGLAGLFLLGQELAGAAGWE
ncbi:MAG: ABC transporter permease [Bacillota bacterium]